MSKLKYIWFIIVTFAALMVMLQVFNPRAFYEVKSLVLDGWGGLTELIGGLVDGR